MKIVQKRFNSGCAASLHDEACREGYAQTLSLLMALIHTRRPGGKTTLTRSLQSRTCMCMSACTSFFILVRTQGMRCLITKLGLLQNLPMWMGEGNFRKISKRQRRSDWKGKLNIVALWSVCNLRKSIHNTQVNYSQQMNYKPLIPWFIAKCDGKILAPHCNGWTGKDMLSRDITALE